MAHNMANNDKPCSNSIAVDKFLSVNDVLQDISIKYMFGPCG